MEKFIPYEKLSKKQRRERDKKRRVTWGFSPVTRNAQNPKAYNVSGRVNNVMAQSQKMCNNCTD